MLKKIKQLFYINGKVDEIAHQISQIESKINENIRANIFHDSIRGYSELEKLPLNIGRWAGNYSFFYTLHRVLTDFKPKNILELGLGESSKFISKYIEFYLPETKHLITEHDEVWIEILTRKFSFSNRTQIKKMDLGNKIIESEQVICYEGFEHVFNEFYDLIVIDAPFGSERYSRYDIIPYIEKHNFDCDFVIILDDTNRIGEQDTLAVILKLLSIKRNDIYYQTFSGNKSSTIITNKKFLTSL